MIEEIKRLKEEKDVVILAHYYRSVMARVKVAEL